MATGYQVFGPPMHSANTSALFFVPFLRLCYGFAPTLLATEARSFVTSAWRTITRTCIMLLVKDSSTGRTQSASHGHDIRDQLNELECQDFSSSYSS